MSPVSQSDLYAGYEIWKGWDKPFTYSAEDASAFAGETRELRIEGADVLEIGFGSGSFLAWARDSKAKIVGVEINPRLIEAATRFDVELLPAEFERVATANASRFDTIVAFDVFEHFVLDDVIARLRACEIMLKPLGHLILRFPNAQSPFGMAPQNSDPTHKSVLSRSVIEHLSRDLAFQITRYGPSFRIGGGSLKKRLGRRMQNVARDMIAAALNAIYAQNIPWDPVVVLVLKKG